MSIYTCVELCFLKSVVCFLGEFNWWSLFSCETQKEAVMAILNLLFACLHSIFKILNTSSVRSHSNLMWYFLHPSYIFFGMDQQMFIFLDGVCEHDISSTLVVLHSYLMWWLSRYSHNLIIFFGVEAIKTKWLVVTIFDKKIDIGDGLEPFLKFSPPTFKSFFVVDNHVHI